jgi:hypothetical protein
MSRPCQLLLSLSLAMPVLLLAGRARGQEVLEVEQERTFVYEEPNSLSPVLRKLYVGELVLAVERVRTAENAEWIKLRLGDAVTGYARAERLVQATGLPTARYRPASVVRDDKPFGVSAGLYGETFGPILKVRYLFFTRLGAVVAPGLVMDGYAVKGRSITFALVSHLSLHNLSPMVEIGAVNLSYGQGISTLNIWGIYTHGGLEYMFDSGLFINAGVTFVRSLDISVSYSWQDNGNLQPVPNDSFGNVGSHISNNNFYVVHPSIAVGWGF